MPTARHVAKTRRAISPRLATSSLLIMPASHPEDAIAGLGRSTMDDRETEAEHGSGVPRVDDAVVVEPAGQEQGRRLLLDPLFNHGAHRGVGLLVVRLSLCLGGLARNDRQHPGQL